MKLHGLSHTELWYKHRIAYVGKTKMEKYCGTLSEQVVPIIIGALSTITDILHLI